MPFVEAGEDTPWRVPDATLQVEPDKILQLKRRLEDRRDAINNVLDQERESLRGIRPPGADPCSEACARGLSENGTQATEVLDRFVQELATTIAAVDEAARTYGLVEEENTTRFRQVHR